jgi:hypothetical protein
VSPPDENAELDLAVLSEVIGDGRNLFGLADGEAAASGFFFVDQGETFAFDLSLNLEVLTSIDNPESESALALGNFVFPLFSQTLTEDGNSGEFGFLSGLEFSALLNTPGEPSLPEPFIGDGFEITPQLLVDSVGLEQAYILDVQGRYEQTFAQPTFIRVQQARFNGIAIAQAVPSPSVLWGILSIGAIGIFGQGKRALQSAVKQFDA